MEFKEIQELIKLIDNSGLTSFEMEKESLKISIKKEANKIFSQEVVQQGVYTEHISGPTETQTFETPQYPKVIASPIVGTFYIAPAPGATPFVQPGSKVKKGQTVCIIEAMKLMNEIQADEDMEIIEVLVADGEMVEYGQPLFAGK
ncbi:MAG: acetyl-CoA carboxylase biotin carboxyl carrier protein [Peptococcaceae bacterium]|nr:acetyl-CoA carboxylase biotin carboxyl carrier protein [Peptococcaceae bacterium]